MNTLTIDLTEEPDWDPTPNYVGTLRLPNQVNQKAVKAKAKKKMAAQSRKINRRNK